jgi:hypothetical protein
MQTVWTVAGSTCESPMRDPSVNASTHPMTDAPPGPWSFATHRMGLSNVVFDLHMLTEWKH